MTQSRNNPEATTIDASLLTNLACAGSLLGTTQSDTTSPPDKNPAGSTHEEEEEEKEQRCGPSTSTNASQCAIPAASPFGRNDDPSISAFDDDDDNGGLEGEPPTGWNQVETSPSAIVPPATSNVHAVSEDPPGKEGTEEQCSASNCEVIEQIMEPGGNQRVTTYRMLKIWRKEKPHKLL